MPLTKAQVKEVVGKNNGGTWYDAYGPSMMGEQEVWEAWVKLDGLFENRFVVLKPNGSIEYLDSFQTFAPYFDGVYRRASGAGVDIHLQQFKAYVAATVFMLAACGILYIALTRGGTEALVAVLGLVSSGGAFFFGRWIPNQA
ncbi:MAG: hypothetical protein ABUL43_00085 [Hyphomicrobium sp.]